MTMEMYEEKEDILQDTIKDWQKVLEDMKEWATYHHIVNEKTFILNADSLIQREWDTYVQK